jgi:hypothetical protein
MGNSVKTSIVPILCPLIAGPRLTEVALGLIIVSVIPPPICLLNSCTLFVGGFSVVKVNVALPQGLPM